MKRILVSIFSICILFSTSLAVEGTNRTVKVNKVISDEISEKGEVDYFNFSLSDPGSVQLRFDFDVQGNYTVKLINTDTAKTIQTNNFKSDVNTSNGRYEKFSNKMRVDEGDYQVQVSCGYFSTCDEDYELEILYDEEDSDRYEKEPNNEAKTAMLIDYNKDITGNLESTNDVDYYMVELPTNGELYTELKFDNEATYNVEIFSESNGSLKSLQNKKYEAKLNQNSNTYLDTGEKLRVPKGNYYFKISRNWTNYSNEDYVFSVKFSKNSYGNFEVENNNEAKNANEISLNTEFIGNLNSSYDVDYYRVNIWDTTKFTIKMNIPENAEYTVTTYKDVNGSLSQIKSERFANKELIGLVSGEKQDVTYGDYYFKVSSRKYSNNDYTFLVETERENNYNNEYNYPKTTIILEVNNPYMKVNGVPQLIDGTRGTVPIIVNGRTMLPARALIETLGGSTFWNDASRGINIILGGKNIYLTLDNTLAYVNGEAKYLDVAPASINGRTMIPVKFVMDNLGASVIWNGATGTVTITY